MRIAILGAGRTGSYVASILSSEKHDVTVIDTQLAPLEKVSSESDVATYHANPPSWTALLELTDPPPDLFFACTGSDEVNLLSCSIAKHLGIAKTISVVKKREYLQNARLDPSFLFQVDHLLSAELLAAQDLFKVLLHSGDLAFEHFAHGAIQMRTFHIPGDWEKSDVPLKDLHLPEEMIIGLIRRKDKIIFPHGQDHIHPHDELTAIGQAQVIHELHKVFPIPEHRIASVILVGGSPVALHLAHLLSEQRIDVRIIEVNADRCLELAELLPNATIIQRDGRDPQLLLAERVLSADAFVSCTNEDETNLYIAALGKQLGARRAIALITDPHTGPILEQVGVVPALSARVNIANQILSLLDEETLLSVSSLFNDQVKIVEVKVAPSSRLSGIPLSELRGHLPPDLLIACIENQGRVMVGRGSRLLCPHDTAIVLCSPERIPELKELFS
jgi:trk system potassium uptake protein TrkA